MTIETLVMPQRVEEVRSEIDGLVSNAPPHPDEAVGGRKHQTQQQQTQHESDVNLCLTLTSEKTTGKHSNKCNRNNVNSMVARLAESL